MQSRRTIAIATGIAIGLSFGAAPHAGARVPTIAVVDDAVWPIDALDAFVVAAPAIAVVPPAAVPLADAVPAEEPTAPAAEPASAPTAEPSATPDVVPVTDAGEIRVEVATADGARRTVSLQTADGTLVSGPVTVAGAPIVFSGLAAGTYDLFVEQFADGGGTFLTRTVIAVDDDVTVARCDENLDCTVG